MQIVTCEREESDLPRLNGELLLSPALFFFSVLRLGRKTKVYVYAPCTRCEMRIGAEIFRVRCIRRAERNAAFLVKKYRNAGRKM